MFQETSQSTFRRWREGRPASTPLPPWTSPGWQNASAEYPPRRPPGRREVKVHRRVESGDEWRNGSWFQPQNLVSCCSYSCSCFFFSAEVISVLMLMLLQGKRPAKCLQELSLPSGLGRPACCSSVVATSGIVRFR